ncbi:MAG: pyridoxine 5'-phosphate synthase [Gammaproteobacteria bacterium]|nr:pyridoxine 5'-phosphate synthase [Gammaproteobacteria bacterium]
MTKLSVNVNKLATLRNSREKNNPDVLKTTLDIISYGAEGITVHPRPDGRHIRKEDVYNIAKAIHVEFNIEGYPDKNFLTLMKEVRPTQCTLVPDPPHVLTSNAGWRIEEHVLFLQETIVELHQHGIRTSLFVDPHQMTAKDIELLKVTGTDRVELYTEAYADAFDTPNADKTLAIYKRVALEVNKLGIDLNAGHDLNLKNLRHFINEIPSIKEVSIGHALICDALQLGMKEAVSQYLACLDS